MSILSSSMALSISNKYHLKSKVKIALVGFVWMCSITTGLAMVVDYEFTPGESGVTPEEWPTESSVNRIHGLPNLLISLHPHCSCSQASVEELERLLTDTDGKVATTALFYVPSNADKNWKLSSLWKKAQVIPGVKIVADIEGVEADLFGAKISGHTVLYDSDGKLVFTGGITASRGHSGDNIGRAAITSFLNKKNSEINKTPSFGCELHTSRGMIGGSYVLG